MSDIYNVDKTTPELPKTEEITYNKLVRDLIPDIIKSSGSSCTTVVLDEEEYLKMLDAKLDEELLEYHKDHNIEELADLLEVLYAVVAARGYTMEQLESVRTQKALSKGTFQNRILLKTVFNNK